MIRHLPPSILICTGACAGALARWQIGLWLKNCGFDTAWGILAANYLDCLLMGAAMAYTLEDTPKLLLLTGFLGSLTTFSTFSADIIEKITQQQWGQALMWLLLHTGGGLSLTLIGLLLARLCRSA